MSNGMQVQLPESVTLQLKTQDVITILGALGEYGPHKAVNPVIMNLEQQLLSQQLPQKYQGPPPGAPAPQTESPTPSDTMVEVVQDVIAHHPV